MLEMQMHIYIQKTVKGMDLEIETGTNKHYSKAIPAVHNPQKWLKYKIVYTRTFDT